MGASKARSSFADAVSEGASKQNALCFYRFGTPDSRKGKEKECLDLVKCAALQQQARAEIDVAGEKDDSPVRLS
jgi:hypothetical protein